MAGASVAASTPASPRWGWTETYVVILFLSSGLLLVPGAQVLRGVIRALPYLGSLALLAYYDDKGQWRGRGPAQLPLALALVLYAIHLFHPTTDPRAGIAQVVFQLTIAAPLWWAARSVGTRAHLDRLLWIIFAVNALSALVGLLQVFFPARLMPPELSAGVDPAALAQMTYSVGGRSFIRPPGLSDIPGGAALSGMIVGFLGIAYGVRARVPTLLRIVCLGASAVGVIVLLLTSARALSLTMLFALAVLFAVVVQQGRGKESLMILLVSAVAGVGTYLAALKIGGQEVVRRFGALTENGLLNSYASNRGMFLQETFDNLLPRYPMGAGLGRWGMMRVYFGSNDPKYYQIWVEIQPTGWLLDGGVFMWVLYGGALVAALAFSVRWVLARQEGEAAYLAAVVLGIQLMIASSIMAGPTFNTTLGITFWLVTGALFGALGRPRPRVPASVPILTASPEPVHAN